MLINWRKKNKNRFKQITNPHLKLMYNMALKYCGNSYDAEDLVQETMFIAFKNYGKLKDEEKVRGWLLVILRNLYLKESGRDVMQSSLNEGMAYGQLLEKVDAGKIEIDFEKKLAARQVQMILDRLPEKYKTPLLLYYMQDFSYQEISDDLGIPIGTVMSRLARSKMHFKKLMIQEVAGKDKSMMQTKSKIVSLADYL